MGSAIDRVEIVAHRAGNTVQHARDAVGRADVIELDAHVRRGRVEVRHEKVVWPTNRLWEKWYLLPAGMRGVPLQDVLGVLDPDVELLVDLKCFTARSGRRIRAAIGPDRAVIASCRSWWVLRSFGGRANTRTLRSCSGPVQLAVARLVPGLGDRRGVAVHERLLDSRRARRLLRRTPLLFVWGAGTAVRCRELTDLGVAGLILDDVGLADGVRPGSADPPGG